MMQISFSTSLLVSSATRLIRLGVVRTSSPSNPGPFLSLASSIQRFDQVVRESQLFLSSSDSALLPWTAR